MDEGSGMQTNFLSLLLLLQQVSGHPQELELENEIREGKGGRRQSGEKERRREERIEVKERRRRGRREEKMSGREGKGREGKGEEGGRGWTRKTKGRGTREDLTTSYLLEMKRVESFLRINLPTRSITEKNSSRISPADMPAGIPSLPPQVEGEEEDRCPPERPSGIIVQKGRQG
eukprot:560875-Hanusia_phi.AAC.1